MSESISQPAIPESPLWRYPLSNAGREGGRRCEQTALPIASTTVAISVVTVVLNGAATLPDLLNSIGEQAEASFEHIVIDGGSTDGTLEVLQNEPRVDYWLSESDSGIAAAMNKGLRLARGVFVLFVNADDRLAGPTTLKSASAAAIDPQSIWAGDIYFHRNAVTVQKVSPRPFNFWARVKNPLPHQGVLCPRALFVKLGGFDESFRIDMDYEFWMRAYTFGIPLRRVPLLIAAMGGQGVSSRLDWAGLSARFAEERRVHRRYGRRPLLVVFYLFYWPSYLIYRRFRALWFALRA